MKTSLSGADVLDTRIVFRVYAACASAAGVFVLIAPPGLGSTIVDPHATRAFLQLSGCLLVALGCTAAGFGEIEEPRSRHRALGCFAFAHLVALAGFIAVAVTSGGIDEGDVVPPILVLALILLFYFWQTGDGYRAGESMQFTKLFAGPRPPDDHLRSAYEERIREAASQEERHRLARDLHDSVKQQIFAMQAAAATVQARFDSDAEGAKDAVERLRASGREAMAEMEAMLDSLRSTPLTNAGLVEALKKQGEALQFRTGAQVRFEIGTLPPDEALAPGAQQAVFRVAQEAFANIGRHARAAKVVVALAAEGDRLLLGIQDDGAGFTTGAPAGGMGLANMRERARAFNARLDVDSQPGAGTRVRLALPFAGWARADISDYRRRVVAWASVVAFMAAVLLFGWLAGWSRQDLPTFFALFLANVIIFLRVVAAYVKARRRAEAATWIESPSHS